jgi:serine/threonine protein phosphatase PrpC
MHSYVFSQASVLHPDHCEDAVLVLDQAGNAPVFAVIDGMGGHSHENEAGQAITGRNAALSVRDTLSLYLGDVPPDASAEPTELAEQRLIYAINAAHRKLMQDFNAHRNQRERVGVVMTVLMLCENGTRALIAQIGDTRAYRLTDGVLSQLCTDEDNIEYMVRRALLSAEDGLKVSHVLNTYDGLHDPEPEGWITIADRMFPLKMAWHWFMNGNQELGVPGAHVVINALGVRSEAPELLIGRAAVRPGDRLLLCSDGIYKNLSQDEIIAQLNMSGDAAAALGEAAYLRSQEEDNARSTPDDLSAVVVLL